MGANSPVSTTSFSLWTIAEIFLPDETMRSTACDVVSCLLGRGTEEQNNDIINIRRQAFGVLAASFGVLLFCYGNYRLLSESAKITVLLLGSGVIMLGGKCLYYGTTAKVVDQLRGVTIVMLRSIMTVAMNLIASEPASTATTLPTENQPAPAVLPTVAPTVPATSDNQNPKSE